MVEALLDLNVILDVMQHREPFYDDSAAVLAAAETGRLNGLVAAHGVTTLFYLLARYGSPEQARVSTLELLSVLTIAPVDGHVIEQALALPYRDLEDAVQMAAARQAGADYLVTRDRAGYAAGPLHALTPAELLALLPKRSGEGGRR
ncbi:MAG: PIN domain-containing protein [Actinomycetes bacterium]